MLTITTAQQDAKLLDTIFKQVLPHVDTPRKIVPWNDSMPYAAEGDVVLGMGTAVLDWLRASELYPSVKKNTSLSQLRGGYLTTPHGGRVMMTYDPFLASIDPAMEPNIVWDTRLACRLHDTGQLSPPVGNYQYVDNFNALIEEIQAIYAKTGKPVAVSPDLETIGLDPLHKGDDTRPPARIVTISFTATEGSAHVMRMNPHGLPYYRAALDQIRWLLTSPMVNSVGANLKFDAYWIAVHWRFDIKNQKADTMLIGSLLNENRSNSLNLHAKMMTPLGGYDEAFNDVTDKSRMDLALAENPEGFLTYAGGDTDACLRTYNVMKPQLLADKRLTVFYTKLLQPSAKVFAKVEQRGMVVDIKRYEKLAVEVSGEIKRLTIDALAHVPNRIKYKFSDKEPEQQLGSPKFMEEFLFTKSGLNLPVLMNTPSGKAPSTAMEHLDMHADNPEAKAFVDIMRELNSAKKTMSTYITGFMKHVRSDGRFHPTYNLHRGDYDGSDSGSVTGRTSAKDPAVQTIPKHTKWAKKLRSVYTCPPGMAILKADFSQGELRVTACVANEKNMLGTYKQGIDLHLRTGALVNHLTLAEALALKASKDPADQKRIKMIRQGGKAGNFGLIYGMSAGGFMDYARIAYGVPMSLHEAETFRNAFFTEYPGLIDWHIEFKAFAKRWGFVRSPLGRVRHLPLIHSKRSELRAEAERQSINSPIQSCLSDMMQLGMVELDRLYPDLWIFGMTHDDVGMYVPVDELEVWAYRVKEVLESLPLAQFGFNPAVDFVVDTEASLTNLSECTELELLLAA